MSRNRPNDSADATFHRTRTVSSTEAQNNFGELMQHVAGDEVVYIQNRGVDRAVILSAETYRALTGDHDELVELEREFDEMLAAMQTEEASAAADALFAARPEELGDAALRAAEAESPPRSRRAEE